MILGSIGIFDSVLPFDPDAQAFITAASITDPTQQSAINQLVVDLKGYNIWTKMKALYPFVGSTASQHKWNLKDPRDLDAAFRLRFFGGTIHTANGVQGNALNAYYNTYLNANSLPISSNASGVYIRTDVSEGGVDFGAINTNAVDSAQFGSRNTSNQYVSRWYMASNGLSATANTDSRGFYQLTRRNSIEYITAKNTSKVVVAAPASSFIPSMPFYGLAAYFVPTAADAFHGSKQIAFHYFADSSLSNTELDNLYTAVQAFQVTLGRSIGTQTVSDADAQAFVTNAGIVDQVEANAVNNLVIGLKADGLWTKIYAAYPMVGGTSTTTSYNLLNTAQYQITWNGGWTWNNNGVTPNGTNGFGNTGFNPVTVGITKTNFGVSAYSRTNIVENGSLLGLISAAPSYIELRPRRASNVDVLACYDDSFGFGDYLTNSLGLITASRSGTTQKYYQGATEKSQRTGFAATADLNGNIYIGGRNFIGFPADSYSTKQMAWVAFHEFFDATQQTNYSNRIQTFQTALARQV